MRLFKNFKGSALFLGLFIFYFFPFFVNATLSCVPLNYISVSLFNVGLVIICAILPLIVFPAIFFILRRRIMKSAPGAPSEDTPKLKIHNVLFSGIIGGLTIFFSNNIALAIRDLIITNRGTADVSLNTWDSLSGWMSYPFIYSLMPAIILTAFIAFFSIPNNFKFANIYRISSIVSMGSGPLIGMMLLTLFISEGVLAQVNPYINPTPCADYILIKASSWNGYATSAFIAGILIILAVIFYRNILSKTTIKSN